MSHKTRFVALLAAGALMLPLAACASTTPGGAANCNVGITMPTRSLERWINDGEQLHQGKRRSFSMGGRTPSGAERGRGRWVHDAGNPAGAPRDFQ